MNAKSLIALGVLAMGLVLPASAPASAYSPDRPHLSIREAKREATQYFDKVVDRWTSNSGATLPIEPYVGRGRSIHYPERLARNLVVFVLWGKWIDADAWTYEINGYLRVRETRPGHYFVRGADIEVHESSNE